MKKFILIIVVLFVGMLSLMLCEAKPSQDYWNMYIYSPDPEEISERIPYEYMGKISFLFLKNKDEVFVIDETDLVLYFKKTNDCDLVTIDNVPIFKTKFITLSEGNSSEYFVVTYDDIVKSHSGRIVYIQVVCGDDDCEGYSTRKDYFFTFTTSDYIQTASESTDIIQKISDENTVEYIMHDPIKIYK